MSSSHAHSSYARLRAGESQPNAKSRTTQHRSANRYSPYTRPSHISPTRGRQRFSSPPSPPAASTGASSKMTPFQRCRVGDADFGHSCNAPVLSRPRGRYHSPVGDSEECPGCPVHPPPTRNNNWLEPSVAHRSRYRSYEGHEDEDLGTPLRLHSPPPRQPTSGSKPTLMSLQRRMDQFDQVLSKLVREVADVKRRGSHEPSLPVEPAHNSSSSSSHPVPPTVPGADLDRLDRMMDELHFLKNRSSPMRDSYRYSPERRATTDNHYGCR